MTHNQNKNMKIIKDSIRLILGFVVFLVTGRQQERAYQAMIGLFCRTGGKSNDFISYVISLFRQKAKFELSEKEKENNNKLVTVLKDNGIVSLGNYLSKED